MTFYFYDLETSGFSPRAARVMQFAGQRTDMDLKPLDEPDNILIKMTSDILPDPDAVLVHGITPQQTISEGMNEAEFVKYLTTQVFIPDTIAVGYNSIRFDDEFMRFSFWRNFTDAYEWQWKDARSRWDLLDVVRMMRALRPEGIKWPFAPDGKPSNRLEYLTSVNKLDHANAHDALSDVHATIAIARLIQNKQPKLFDYLLRLRDKKRIAALVTKGQPIIYTSGRYPAEYEKTTVAVMVAAHPERGAALVYDLRIDPDEFTKLPPAELAKLWGDRDKDAAYFPLKLLAYNKCPAIAPLAVLDAKSAARLKINSKIIDANFAKLQKSEDFGDKLIAALEINQPRSQTEALVDLQKVDEQLYDGFVNDNDKTKMRVVRAANTDGLADLQLDFADERLKLLLPLYKARNYPKSLNQDEQKQWEEFRKHKLLDGGDAARAASFFKRLRELEKQTGLSAQQRYLLEELNLYGQSLVPAE
jgi:exodeoxyribonuclease-1